MQNAVTDESVEDICTEHEDELRQVGCRIGSLKWKNKESIMQSIKLHHVLLKSKAELDQLIDGLGALGVLKSIRENNSLFERLFVASHCDMLNAGKQWVVVSNCNII